MTYTLATHRIRGRPTAVVQAGGRRWTLDRLLPDVPGLATGGLFELLQDWERLEPLLATRLAEAGEPLPPPAEGEVLAPILYPGKVCCTGANYRDHLSEVGLSATFDKARVRPSFFMKPPRTAVVGPGRTVRYPVQTKQFDWEIELAVVIGRTARHVSAADALACVAAYTVGMDLSARDYLLHPGNMSGFDTFGGKGFDDSCPLGPALVPARFVTDPQDLPLALTVNGEVMQVGNTSQMVWTVAEQIAEMSAVMTLQPGDVLLTGTPPGSGLSRGRFLGVGDRIAATIGGIGCLEVEVIASPWQGQAVPCPLIPAERKETA